MKQLIRKHETTIVITWARMIYGLLICIICAIEAIPSIAAAEPTQGAIAASVREIIISETRASTTTRTARVIISIRNVGESLEILAYRMGSARLSDDAGNQYRWAIKKQVEGLHVFGIGFFAKNVKTDLKFQLLPGQSREMIYEGIMRYNKKKGEVAGSVFALDITLVSVIPISSKEVKVKRENPFRFTEIPSRMSSK